MYETSDIHGKLTTYFELVYPDVGDMGSSLDKFNVIFCALNENKGTFIFCR